MAPQRELIPYSIITTLINQLNSSSFYNFSEIYNIKDQLQNIKFSIESIQELLLIGDEIGTIDEEQEESQEWITNLKHVLLHADNYFELIATQILLNPNRLTFRSKFRNFFSLSNPFVLKKRIKKIEKDFDVIVENSFNLRRGGNRISTRPVTNLNLLEFDHIIGREDEKNKIVSMLLENNNNNVENNDFSSIAIVGLGGIGKTTLARMVYNDEQVKGFYQKQLWNHVSDCFDVETIVKKILGELIGDEIDDQEKSFQQDLICRHLNGTRYLLVLDDVWNESYEKWTQLRSYLMCGAQGSKILVTTRSRIVAEVMGVDQFLFNLKGLSDQESLSLLMMLALPSIDQSDEGEYDSPILASLNGISKIIAKITQGVPLEIKTAATVLHGKYKWREWNSAYKGDLWNLGEEKDGIMYALRLSYQHLSPQLKQCFAYCSLFPKNWEIEKKELVQLWMAEGYLECLNDAQQMEDVGNEFVDILLKKSFFQDEKFDEHGNLVSFKMHELMRELRARSCLARSSQ